jgi:uncharacterized protein (DUF1778 family)
MRIPQLIGRSALTVALLFLIPGCSRSRGDVSSSNASALIFDSASPEAQRALAQPVGFRLTEENFAEWEAAQKYLDALPKSAFPSGGSSAGNPIDRAVERLESSPRARTAIERTGLTVRDFVLETIALAQATEAMTAANSSSMVRIPPENLQFVTDHRSRVVLALHQREASEETASTEPESGDLAPGIPSAADVDTSGNVDTAARSRTGTQGRADDGALPRDTAPLPAQQPTRDSAGDTIPPPL